MKILAVTLGSSGDVDPMVGIGSELKRRGHEVSLITHAPFEKLAHRAGLDFAAVDTLEEYQRHLQTPDMDPNKLLATNLMRSLEPVYRQIAERITDDTVVVSQSAALGARLAHDKFGMPLVTIHLQPYAFDRGSPEQVAFMDKPFLKLLNPLREKLGLAPQEGVFGSWMDSPRRIVAFFPRWFAPDLKAPEQTRFTNFPLFDEGTAVELPKELEEFLQAGDPPVVFTFGTAMSECRPLMEASAEACRRLNLRGLLLTRYKDQIPPNLPPTVRHFDFIPFSQVLPRSAAIVHHGGIGTTAQSLLAGIPQVIVPFAFDQPQNADLIKGLGVGEKIKPADYTGTTAAAALKKLLESSSVPDIAAKLKERVSADKGVELAADEVEASL